MSLPVWIRSPRGSLCLHWSRSLILVYPKCTRTVPFALITLGTTLGGDLVFYLWVFWAALFPRREGEGMVLTTAWCSMCVVLFPPPVAHILVPLHGSASPTLRVPIAQSSRPPRGVCCVSVLLSFLTCSAAGDTRALGTEMRSGFKVHLLVLVLTWSCPTAGHTATSQSCRALPRLQQHWLFLDGPYEAPWGGFSAFGRK